MIKYVFNKHFRMCNNIYFDIFQPCLLEGTSRFFITSQNHGFVVQTSQGLAQDWSILFTNLNDQSNEGIVHDSKPFFSAQFYPEHCARPYDTENLFKIFVVVQSFKSNRPINVKSYLIEQLTKRFSDKNASSAAFCGPVKKVLILDSGSLTSQEAEEFYYLGILIKFISIIFIFILKEHNQ